MNLEKRIALVIDLGTSNYFETYKLQQELAKKRSRNEVPDTILISEHHPVVNFGMVELYNTFSDILYEQLTKNNIAPTEKNAIKYLQNQGIPFVRTKRGGGATYIGPGQINIYPVINFEELTQKKFGIDKYKEIINSLMNNIIRSYNVNSKIEDQNLIRQGEKINDERAKTGERKDIWVTINNKNYKLGGRGIHTTGPIAYHGFNFYVKKGSTEGFKYVNACGYTPNELGTISIEEATQKTISINEFKERTLTELKKQFRYDSIQKINLNKII